MATLQAGFPVRQNNSPEATEVTSLTFAVTVAAGTNTAMAVSVGYENNGSGGVAVSSVTFNGDSLTQHAAIDTASWSGTAVFQRAAPDVATGNVVVTMSTADKYSVGVYVANDVDQTTPLRTAQTAQAATGTSVGPLTVASVVTGDIVFDSLSLDSNGAAPVQGADQTEQWDYATAGTFHSHASSTQPGASGGAMGYSWTGSRPYSYIATAFAEAGGAAAPIPPLVTAPYRPYRR